MSKTVELTLPKKRVVRGYTVRKMNLGEQIQALAVLEELPNEVMKTCFPGQGPSAVLLGLQGFTADSIVNLFMGLMKVVPEQAVKFFAQLSGIDEKVLLEDTNIGLDGFVELLASWLEVNDIENFINAVRGLVAKWTAKTNYQEPTGGYKGLLHKLLPWASAKKNS